MAGQRCCKRYETIPLFYEVQGIVSYKYLTNDSNVKPKETLPAGRVISDVLVPDCLYFLLGKV